MKCKISKKLILVGLSVFVLGGAFAFLKFKDEDGWICENEEWVRHGNPSYPMPKGTCYEAGVLQRLLARLRGEKVYNISEITEPGNPPEQEPVANIIVESPKPGDSASYPLVIAGKARIFENQFNYRLKDENGAVLMEGWAYANSPDAGLFGPFEIRVAYPAPSSEEGTVELFDFSMKDGSEIDKVIVPVKLANVETMMVKVFFNNDSLDITGSCEKVFPVNRKIAKTEAAARSALIELLAGLSEEEKSRGYQTNIPQGVGLNSVKIVDGVAYADFDKNLEKYGGGSCRVAAIQAQIAETLKQFPTVKSVVISIDGRTEDILQP